MIEDIDPFGTSDIKRKDFITELTTEILDIFKGINPLWAEACARATLATILDKVTIPYLGKPLALNEYNICIGPPGSIKSLPMDFCDEIILEADKRTNYNFILPSKFSSASMIEHLSELRKGTEKKWPRQYKHTHGIIIRDEFTSLFKQSRKTDWAIDMLEFLSEMYDGKIRKKRTIERGEEKAPKEVYVNLLTATTFDFISKVDDDFFNQGTGTRFLYTVIEPDAIELKPFEWKHFHKGVAQDRQNIINRFAGWLKELYKVTELQELQLSYDAFKPWNDYNTMVKQKWLRLISKDPLNWEYPYLVRLPEYVLKLAGLYAISRQSEFIIRLKENDRLEQLKEIKIDIEDFYRAKKTIKLHHESFKKFIKLRAIITGRMRPISHMSIVDSIVEVLGNTTDKCSNYSQWFAIQTVVSSEKTFYKYVLTAIASGRVLRLKRGQLTQEQIDKYKINTSASLYKFVK